MKMAVFLKLTADTISILCSTDILHSICISVYSEKKIILIFFIYIVISIIKATNHEPKITILMNNGSLLRLA